MGVLYPRKTQSKNDSILNMELNFNKLSGEILPAVIQDNTTDKVLMVGFITRLKQLMDLLPITMKWFQIPPFMMVIMFALGFAFLEQQHPKFHQRAILYVT